MTETPSFGATLRDPELFARTFLKIVNKDGRLVRLRYNIVQQEYLRQRTRRDLVLKARQMGISTVIQAEFFRRAITRTCATVTLAHEDETTQRFRRMVDRFYDNLPDGFIPLRKYNNARLSSYPDFDSEAIIATAGNKNTGRGGTATHIHGSEVAFWKDAEALMAGLMQGGHPAIVLESTPNGARGYFYQLCMEARDGNPDWNLIVIPWWTDPEYALPLAPEEVLTYTEDEAALVEQHGLTPEQIKWRRSKQRELKSLFIQEYIEDALTCFLLSGLGYFGDVSTTFTAPMQPVYDPTHLYVAGLDWGQANDYTVLVVLDVTTRLMVDMVHVNNLEWKEMRRRCVEKCVYWHVRTVVAEENSMGSTNIEALRSELSAAGARCGVVPFVTSNDSKSSAMAGLHETLHEPDGYRLQSNAILKRELMAFSAYQSANGTWTLHAPSDEHDDFVIALALAFYGANRGLTDSEVASIGTNAIDATKLPQSLLDALKASGVDIRSLRAGVRS